MGSKVKWVDAYIAASADFAKPILTHLRGLVHKACPEVTEIRKWSFPHFEYHGLLCSMAAFKHHCAFGFWKARLMEDFDTAMGHFGQLKSLKDLPPDKRMVAFIKEAMRLNTAGIKLERQPALKIKKKLTVPSDFKKLLARDTRALKTFEAFSYSNKKDYLDWITDAKTDATRIRRMNQSVEWLAEGKIRNWKYT
jgi:uncharacterized protein YdeI (YjbR/CyaY-like superfamily)